MARQANVMLILAGVLVGVVLGYGLGSFVDIDLQERLDSLWGGPAPVVIAKQHVREVLQPAEEEEIANSFIYTSLILTGSMVSLSAPAELARATAVSTTCPPP